MSAWLIVVLAGAGSYLLRVSMLVLAARGGVPAVLERAAPFAVPVAFAALAATSLARHGTDGAVAAYGAVAVAVVVARRTGSPPTGLLVALPVLWLLFALTG